MIVLLFSQHNFPVTTAGFTEKERSSPGQKDKKDKKGQKRIIRFLSFCFLQGSTNPFIAS